MDTPDDPATRYANDVVDGKFVTGKLVRLACERHLLDLKEGASRGLLWKPDDCQYGIDFFHYLKHSKGEFAGKEFILGDWQKFRIGSTWGWKREDTGHRRFRTCFNDVARKNGKTTEAAGVGLALLIADGEAGAEVYSAATKKEQAALTFDEASRMIKYSDELSQIVDRQRGKLLVEDTDSKFEPLSSDSRTLDGLNPHGVIVDELHKHANRNLLDVMDTALGARRQPLLWIITTSGDDDPNTVYAQERLYAEQILSGINTNDSYFAYIACVDEKDDWQDPANWIKGNPNLGISVGLRDLDNMFQKAKGMPTAQREFKRLRLNMRVALAGKAIPLERWVLCTEGPIDQSALRGRRCYVGIDLSSKLDLTAAVLLFPPETPGERFKLIARFWCPGENVRDRETRDRAQYEEWIRQGWIEATPGDIIDHGALKAQILEWNREFQIKEALFDPWNATQLSVELGQEGIQMREFQQTTRNYSPPTNEFLAMVQAQHLEHGGNPVMTWMANNLAVEEDRNRNIMPTKRRSIGRIDGMTGAIMAVAGHLADTHNTYNDGANLVVL